ncbi:MAG: DUF5074 domain-containing protein [Bacteroidota bacterium]
MGREAVKALIALLCCIVAGCVKDKPGTRAGVLPNASGNVYVVCEGSFSAGGATLYAYNTEKDSVYGDLYALANGNQQWGDVFQSMQRIGDKLFLCINNSDKVIMLQADNWKLSGSISIPKPRYILPVSATKAYVSTLYSNKLYIIDIQACTVTGTIELPSMNPEGMCIYNNAAFVCTWDTAVNSIYKVDVTGDRVMQTIKVGGYGPQEALLDKEQMMWVLSGNQRKNRQAALTRIDPSNGNILTTYLFPADADVLKPVFNKTKDTLYFIEVNYNGGITNNGVYRMAITDADLPAEPFLQAQRYQYFWALGIDPQTNEIYVGDPKGFVQKGSVAVYNPAGVQLRSFNVGLGPGHFYFDK